MVDFKFKFLIRQRTLL